MPRNYLKLTGHSGRCNYNPVPVQLCEKYDIKFVLLPPNSTHLCQPLDVAFFRPLKLAWRKVLDVWKKKNRGVVPKCEFPTLLRNAFEEVGVNSASNVQSGFRKAGIYPLCPQKVLSQIPSTGTEDSPSDQQSWTDSFVDT